MSIIRSAAAMAIVAGMATLVSVSAAHAKQHGHQVRFAGVHPIPKAAGGGFCHIDGPHVHVYALDPRTAKLEYRLHGDDEVFVGDPMAYGWDGPKISYVGPHPIQIDAVVAGGGPAQVEYCYLTGPHFHVFTPPEDPRFVSRANAYWYVGTMPQAYVDARVDYATINAVYEPIEYDRPPVVVAMAPQGWVGASVDIDLAAPPPPDVEVRGGTAAGAAVGEDVDARGGAGVGVGIAVRGPSVHIEVPEPPSLRIGVSGGIRVGGKASAHGGGGGRVIVRQHAPPPPRKVVRNHGHSYGHLRGHR